MSEEQSTITSAAAVAPATPEKDVETPPVVTTARRRPVPIHCECGD